MCLFARLFVLFASLSPVSVSLPSCGMGLFLFMLLSLAEWLRSVCLWVHFNELNLNVFINVFNINVKTNESMECDNEYPNH